VTAPSVAALSPITALVCTRNRGDSVARAVRSILANTHPDFRVVVVDQSDDDRSEQALAPLRDSPRLRYIRTPTRGLCRARNIGLRASGTEVVAITDDDCEVPPDWLAHMARIFAEHPRVAVAFCNVAPAPHDPKLGFIPCYLRRGDAVLRGVLDKCRARGIGAGMAVRRAMVLELGGFDEALGAGGMFPSCDDGDAAVRALLRGYEVYETDSVAVVHHGFRTYQEGVELTRRDWTGIGAAYAKPLKHGHWRFAVVPLYELLAFAVAPLVASTLRLRRPRGLRRISSFAWGFIQGLRTPVDPRTLLFCTR
jgi:GT2 family glycosyltransferase